MKTVADAKQMVLAEWHTWSTEHNSYDNVAMQLFFGWLQKQKPHLLHTRSHQKPWQLVHGWLQNDEDNQSRLRNIK